MYDDAYTRNEDGELAVRTVNVTEGSNSSSYDDVFTRDTNGKLALRVTGGGDSHNKGYFTNLEALQEAYPTGEAGDWAILESTDTVWIWDTDTSAWVDSDQKGQVTSVNGQTGAVVLGAQDVGAVPQYSSMPQASEDELGNIYQFTGTTDANYTNGYFYKCVSDGGNPATYSWSAVQVQAGGGGGLQNTASNASSLGVLGTVHGNASGVVVLGDSAQNDSEYSNYATAVGSYSDAGTYGTAIGGFAYAGSNATAVGSNARAEGSRSIQLGAGNNYDDNTFKVGNNNGNFEIMSADGTVPHGRLTNAVVSNTVTIAVADWAGGTTCTKTVSGLTATSVVWVAPDNASQSDYLTAGVYASAQTTDTITFTCTTTPTSSLTVNVIYC